MSGHCSELFADISCSWYPGFSVFYISIKKEPQNAKCFASVAETRKESSGKRPVEILVSLENKEVKIAQSD